MTKASDNAFPSILITEGTEPSAPAAGKQRLYIDSTTHKLKRTDSSGTDVTIEGAAPAESDVTFTDITTNNASTSKHGYLKKLDNNAAHFMDGTGAWSTPSGTSAASGARVYNNANISLTNGSMVYLTFNTERYDDAAYHDTGSNTGRLTVPSAGRYMIGGHVQITNASGDPTYIAIRLNGTTFIAVSAPGGIANEAGYASVTTMWDCTGGTEFFELGAIVSAGSKNAVSASAFSPEFWIERMGDT